ncbi:HesB-like protein [Clostridium rectalis]|uniref:HesB-like protein n=1 Tax=Clostridium rectalis TaxID=2040295 RepID=UPI000F632732|nr:HesB-like protein [Clostridium rectalis]
MSLVHMSDLAYEEFKNFLETNNVKTNLIRIHLAGIGCSGPAFNLVLDHKRANDEIAEIKNITFLIDNDVIAQFGGFELKCAKENGIGGFSLEPLIKYEGSDCSTCGGCH